MKTNGVASEALVIKEPNIAHVKFIQIEGKNKLLLAICKLIVNDSPPASVQSINTMLATNPNTNTTTTSTIISSSTSNLINDLSSSQTSIASSISPKSHHSNASNNQIPQSVTQPHSPIQTPVAPYQHSSSLPINKRYNISIVNLVTGDLLREIIYNGEILDLKSNSNILCVNSWNRIDGFDLTTFEHKFTINNCYSQVSKSTGRLINPISLGSRWLAFADNKVRKSFYLYFYSAFFFQFYIFKVSQHFG